MSCSSGTCTPRPNKNDIDVEALMKFMEDNDYTENASSELISQIFEEVELVVPSPDENPDGGKTIQTKPDENPDGGKTIQTKSEKERKKKGKKIMSEKERKKKGKKIIKKRAVRKYAGLIISFIVAVILGLIIGLSIVPLSSDKNAETTVITSLQSDKNAETTVITSLQSAINVLDKLEPNKKPCDDFWLYSCGQYIKTNKHLQSLEYSFRMNVKAEMQLSADEEVIALLEESNDESTIEPVKMVKKFYNSCTDKDTVSKTFKADLLKLSESLGGVPMVTGRNFSGNHANILRKYFSVTGKLPLFSYYIMETKRKYSKIINFHSSFRSYSESIGNMAATMKVLFSESIAFEKIFHFYHKLAELTQKRYFTSEDDFSSGTLYTSRELNQFLSELDLVGIFEDILKVTKGTAKNTKFMTQNAEVLKNISRLILETNPTDFMNIVFLETLQEFYGVIPTQGIHFVETLHRDVKSNTYASNKFSAPLLKKSCLDVAHLAGDVLGWMYSEKHFEKQVQDEVSQMVDYLLRATEILISETEWLDTTSKSLALQKLADLKKRIHIGRQNSDEMKNELIKSYADVSLDNKFLSDIITMSKVSSRVKRTLKKNKTFINQNTVNAVYDALSNSITIPVALMKPPLFIKGAPTSITFGGLGTLIGHEILHAFDANNITFQINGKWLSEESQYKYNLLKRRVVKTYSKYKIKSLNANVNGDRTAKENIADLGGLNIAYKAYMLWKSDHPNIKYDLPGIDQTDSQLFFTAFSQASCSSEIPEIARYSLLTDTHSPLEARVQVPLQNYEKFAESFSCSKGTNMNAEHKIKIW